MGNNNCQFNCKKTETIKEEVNYTINETEEKKKNTMYTILKGKYFKSGKIICDFINFQYRRIYCKMQYNKMLFNIENLFIPENNQIPRIKEDYEQILNQKIENFFENKNDILKDIFDKTEFFMDINEFDNLKNMIKQYYANDIYNNKINFYNEFYEYVKEKNNLQIFIEEKRNKENEINVKFKTSIKKLMKIQKLISIKGKVGTLSDTQINFIQNDIENMFNLCLSTPNNKLPKKIDDIQNINKSFFLMLLADEFKLNTKTFVSGKLRIFIKLFYYIYIMKKYNFISKTEDFYNIDIDLIRKELSKLKNDNKQFEESFIKIDEENKEKIRVFPDTERPLFIIANSQDDNTKNDSDENNEEKEKEGKEKEKNHKSIKYLYNGEYDNTTYLFNGYGNLIDIEGNNCYEGMFRYGYKHGIGIFWQDDTKQDNNIVQFYYYSGEWIKDNKSGYGIEISITSISSNVIQNRVNSIVLIGFEMKINLGIFRRNVFLSGEQYQYIFENNIEGKEYLLRKISFHSKENVNTSLIIFNKFQGDLDPQFHKYTGNGMYSSYSYIYNAKKDRYEPNISYIYNGNFINGKENGDGILKKSIHNAKYSFIYKGVFQNGEMDGYGIIQYTENFFLKRYEGFFKQGKKFFLYGRVEFRSGDIYEGFFDNNNLKDFIGLYIHGERTNQIINDNYFGFFQKDKKHGLGRFISLGPSKKEEMVGKYVIGEKQGAFQITIEEYIGDSNLDLISFDLQEDNSEFNILTLATRKKRGIANSQFFGRSKKKKKTKKYGKTVKIKQKKIYYFFENDDILDKSDKPFDI